MVKHTGRRWRERKTKERKEEERKEEGGKRGVKSKGDIFNRSTEEQ